MKISFMVGPSYVRIGINMLPLARRGGKGWLSWDFLDKVISKALKMIKGDSIGMAGSIKFIGREMD